MKGSRPGAMVALALVLATALAACGDDESGEEGDASLGTGKRYVAMGDSYTSAPGAGAEIGEPACLQTVVNYPHRVATALGLDLVDVSCGSAWTTQVTHPQNARGAEIPPQADALTDDTDLVTISLGANDNTLIPNIVFNCVQLAVADPKGSPCRDEGRADPAAYDKVFANITKGLVAAVKEVEDRAPDARIVVVGYPQMFPAQGGCALFPIATGDRQYAHRVLVDLVDAVRSAAAETDVEYLDLWEASAGHDICSDDPWMAGSKPAEGRLAEPYHPYAEGQQAVADLLVKLLEDTPESERSSQ